MSSKSTLGIGSIEGVGSSTKKKLLNGGFDTIERIAEATPSQIKAKCGMKTDDAKVIIVNAKSMFNPRTVAKLNKQNREIWAEYHRLRKQCAYIIHENKLLYKLLEEQKEEFAGLKDKMEEIKKEIETYIPTDYDGSMFG